MLRPGLGLKNFKILRIFVLDSAVSWSEVELQSYSKNETNEDYILELRPFLI